MRNHAGTPAHNAGSAVRDSAARLAMLGLIGSAAGVISGLSSVAAADASGWSIPAHIFGSVAFYLLITVGLDTLTPRVLRDLPAKTRSKFRRYDPLTYLVCLLTLPGIAGIEFPPGVIIFLLILLAKALLLYALLSRQERSQVFLSLGWLSFLFLISGFAALIYQIVWQRVLFAAFGVNIESITVIVSLFMFGLGLGSLSGGLLARRYPSGAPLIFLSCELGIGLFGVISLPLISLVARSVLHGSVLQLSLAVFALLCIPTMLMGATLPVLVNHLYRHYQNVGKAVGTLYCVNTIGSATACFITADVLFRVMGQQASVLVAACCNLTAGVLVLVYCLQLEGRAKAELSSELSRAGSLESVVPVVTRTPGCRSTLKHFVLFFAAATGYISLSGEMLWMRLVAYMGGGRPGDFAEVLGFFLLGVALGAFFGERFCERGIADGRSPAAFVGSMLVAFGATLYLSTPLTAHIHERFGAFGDLTARGLVAAAAFFPGSVFPVLCHYGTRAGQVAGLAVSRVYLANILGSTLGTILTGFVLMEYLTTDRIILALSAASLLLGGASYLNDTRPRRLVRFAAAIAGLALLFLVHPEIYSRFLERLQLDANYLHPRYLYSKENRSGIIAVAPFQDSIRIYGGGAYDGGFNTDPVHDSNGIARAYMIAALHPNPSEVLEVGLSGGSWARVIADYEKVEKLSVVEINPGYLAILRNFPEQASILTDPKVGPRQIFIDDARRWLNRNPDARFDFILQNTTLHWRSNVTNLVSREYLELLKRHLLPGGVVYLNATGSPDIPYTVARVFSHVTMFGTFVAAGDRPFILTPEQIRANLLRFTFNGQRIFKEEQPEYRRVLDELADAPLADLGETLRKPNLARLVVTDDNMATEFKQQPWSSPAFGWMAFYQRRWPQGILQFLRQRSRR